MRLFELINTTDKNTDFNIRWSVRRRATAYQNTTRMCNLCLAEKLEIIKADKKRSLNKRTELVSQNVDTRTASTSVISRRLCHEPIPLHFSDFPTFCFCRFFKLPIFRSFRTFRITSGLFWSCRCFSNFSSFFLCIITRSSSFFDDFFLMILWFFRVYDFLWLFVFPLKSQLHACPLSSPPPPPPMFSTLYLPANFCQFFLRPSCTSYNPLSFPAHPDHTSIQGFEFFVH